jgi:hypothetical protein
MAAGARFWPRSATPSGSLAAVLHAAPGRDLMVFSYAFVCCFWGRTKYVGGRTEWWQRLRVDWDVACYDGGFGDNSKGLPGPPGPPGLPSGGERVKSAPRLQQRGPLSNCIPSSTAQMRMNGQMAGMRCQLLWWLVYSAFTSCSSDAVRRRVRQVEGERERMEGGKMQDAGQRRLAPARRYAQRRSGSWRFPRTALAAAFGWRACRWLGGEGGCARALSRVES